MEASELERGVRLVGDGAAGDGARGNGDDENVFHSRGPCEGFELVAIRST
jgi:hypothetical protein